MVKLIKRLISKYGPVAIGLHVGLFTIVYLVVVVGLSFTSASLSGCALLGAAYALTLTTQPVRYGAVAALTPIVGRRLGQSPPA